MAIEAFNVACVYRAHVFFFICDRLCFSPHCRVMMFSFDRAINVSVHKTIERGGGGKIPYRLFSSSGMNVSSQGRCVLITLILDFRFTPSQMRITPKNRISISKHSIVRNLMKIEHF